MGTKALYCFSSVKHCYQFIKTFFDGKCGQFFSHKVFQGETDLVGREKTAERKAGKRCQAGAGKELQGGRRGRVAGRGPGKNKK